jgi:hypothetical protein
MVQRRRRAVSRRREGQSRRQRPSAALVCGRRGARTRAPHPLPAAARQNAKSTARARSAAQRSAAGCACKGARPAAFPPLPAHPLQ